MFADYLEAFRHFDRNTRLILLTSVLIGLTIFGGIYSVLLNLYLLRLGYDTAFIGDVNAAGALAFVVCSLPAGALGRKWGNRPMLVAGLGLAVLGHGLLPLGEYFTATQQRYWLLGSMTLGSAGTNMYFVNVFPFLMAATRPQQRNHVFSLQMAISPLAAFAGSLIGGFLPGLYAALLDTNLDQPAAYRYPLLLAAVFLAAALILVARTRPIKTTIASESTAPQSTTRRGRPPYKLFIVMGAVTFFQTSGEGVARTFFNVYLDDALGLSTALIGTLSAGGQLLAVGAALAAPLLARYWDRRHIILGGSLGMSLCLIPLALASHWIVAGLGFMGLIAMGAGRRPIYIVFQQESVSPDWRITMSSAVSMSYGLSLTLISYKGGRLIAAWGYDALFLGAALVTLVGTLIFWLYFRPTGKQGNAPYKQSRI